jgi:hypothetical protein
VISPLGHRRRAQGFDPDNSAQIGPRGAQAWLACRLNVRFGTAYSGGLRNAVVFGEEFSEGFGWGVEAEALAGAVVEFGGDGL